MIYKKNGFQFLQYMLMQIDFKIFANNIKNVSPPIINEQHITWKGWFIKREANMTFYKAISTLICGF